VAGAGTELDNIIFNKLVPVESRSWGAVKAMYHE
jgi:hypothetical protein